MNVNTGEIRDEKKLSAEERGSGDWVKVPSRYFQKIPETKADFAALNTAERKRARKAAVRAMFTTVGGI